MIREKTKIITRLSLGFRLWLQVMLFTLLISSAQSYAKQLSFNKVNHGEAYQFNYVWQDQHHDKKSISFRLPNDALFNRFRQFKKYDATLANEYINRKTYRELAKKPIDGVNVNVRKTNKISHLELSATNPKTLYKAEQAVERLKAEFFQQYLRENFYHQFTLFTNDTIIKPDHIAIAEKSVMDLKPNKGIFLEQVPMKNIRTATNYTLNFVQSIPYAPLDDSQSSTNKGFYPPLQLLWENQGDCDSKVTLTAAILRMLMPRVNIILVYIDNHALLGIDLEFKNRIKPNDTFITINNINYLLAEPTGPSLLALGQLSQDSELAIANGHYSVEKLPSTPSKKVTEEMTKADEAFMKEEEGDEESAFMDP